MELSLFVRSPIYDNWLSKQQIDAELIICSPFIKLAAVRKLLDELDIKRSAPNGARLEVYTSGNPVTYVRKGSDVDAIKCLAEVPNVRVHLIMNLRMKAYCVDRSELLISSGNWTPSGMFPGGNVETGLVTDREDDLRAFIGYCDQIDEHALTLDSREGILAFCEELDSIESENKHSLDRMGALEKSITAQSFTYRICRHDIRRTKVHLPLPVFRSGTADLDEARKMIEITGKIDLSELTPENAYLLGGMIVAGCPTGMINGAKKSLIYYGVNGIRSALDKISKDVSEHCDAVMDLLESVAEDAKPRSITDEERKRHFAGKCGFILAFDYDPSYDESNMDSVLSMIRDSHDDIQRASLIGAFDSRATADSTAESIAMDCRSMSMGKAFNDLLSHFGLRPTPVNAPRERRRKDQMARWPQVRLRLEDYYATIGIISPGKATDASSVLGKDVITDFSVLENVKVLTRK